MTAFAAYVAEEQPKVVSPSEVADIMRPVLRDAEQEEFHALLLNTKHNLIRDVMATKGLVDRSQVHAREVFREAIQSGAAACILAHNHPSGDTQPSAEDLRITRQLVEAGAVGEFGLAGSWLSFEKEGHFQGHGNIDNLGQFFIQDIFGRTGKFSIRAAL